MHFKGERSNNRDAIENFEPWPLPRNSGTFYKPRNLIGSRLMMRAG
jgi:hypothetical protein